MLRASFLTQIYCWGLSIVQLKRVAAHHNNLCKKSLIKGSLYWCVKVFHLTVAKTSAVGISDGKNLLQSNFFYLLIFFCLNSFILFFPLIHYSLNLIAYLPFFYFDIPSFLFCIFICFLLSLIYTA